MKQRNFSDQGATLIELLFALGIFTICISTAMATQVHALKLLRKSVLQVEKYAAVNSLVSQLQATQTLTAMQNHLIELSQGIAGRMSCSSLDITAVGPTMYKCEAHFNDDMEDEISIIRYQ